MAEIANEEYIHGKYEKIFLPVEKITTLVFVSNHLYFISSVTNTDIYLLRQSVSSTYPWSVCTHYFLLRILRNLRNLSNQSYQ